MNEQVDPRALLAEMKHWRDWPHAITALTAVLDLGGVMQDNPYDEFASGYNEAMADVRQAITDALGGGSGE